MAGKRSSLADMGSVVEISAGELAAMSGRPRPEPGQPQSLVQRIRAKANKPAAVKSERQQKRERRRQYAADIQARRARGEKI
jgi:hypothetical protein